MMDNSEKEAIETYCQQPQKHWAEICVSTSRFLLVRENKRWIKAINIISCDEREMWWAGYKNDESVLNKTSNCMLWKIYTRERFIVLGRAIIIWRP